MRGRVRGRPRGWWPLREESRQRLNRGAPAPRALECRVCGGGTGPGEDVLTTESRMERVKGEDTAQGEDAARAEEPAQGEEAAQAGKAAQPGEAEGAGDAGRAEAPGGRSGRRAAARAVTVAAFLFVLAALLAPAEFTQLKPAAFARIPVEGIVGAALILAVPARARRYAAGTAGAAPRAAVRPQGHGHRLRRGDVPAVRPGARLAAARVPPSSSSRSRPDGRGDRRPWSSRSGSPPPWPCSWRCRCCGSAAWLPATPADDAGSAAVLGIAWAVCAALGAPVRAPAAGRVQEQRRPRLRPRGADPVQPERRGGVRRGRRGRRLPRHARRPVADGLARQGRRPGVRGELRALGAGAPRVRGPGRRRPGRGHAAPRRRPGSPRAAAGSPPPPRAAASWLAHATLLSGLWVDNQQRYRTAGNSDRFTLTRAFPRAGSRTVGLDAGHHPGLAGGPVLRLRQDLRRPEPRLPGPAVRFATMPDQYTLSILQRNELATRDRPR